MDFVLQKFHAENIAQVLTLLRTFAVVSVLWCAGISCMTFTVLNCGTVLVIVARKFRTSSTRLFVSLVVLICWWWAFCQARQKKHQLNGHDFVGDKIISINLKLNINSPNCVPCIAYNVSSENLVLIQTIFPCWFFCLFTCLLLSVMILQGKITHWPLLDFNDPWFFNYIEYPSGVALVSKRVNSG